MWHNQLPANSFSKLKGLKLYGCDELLNVFPLSVAKVLVQLEDLKISFCEVLEAIVANENEDEATSLFLFPRLTSLTLFFLPQLQRFCFGRFTLRWPLLKELEVWGCDRFEKWTWQQNSTIALLGWKGTCQAFNLNFSSLCWAFKNFTCYMIVPIIKLLP